MTDLCDQVVTDLCDLVMTDMCDQVMTDLCDQVMTDLCDQVVTDLCDQVMTDMCDGVMTDLCDQVMTDLCDQVVTDLCDWVNTELCDQVMTELHAVFAGHPDLHGQDAVWPGDDAAIQVVTSSIGPGHTGGNPVLSQTAWAGCGLFPSHPGCLAILCKTSIRPGMPSVWCELIWGGVFPIWWTWANQLGYQVT